MDIIEIINQFSESFKVFVPGEATLFVPLILIVTWVLYQFSFVPKKLAPAIALTLGLAVAFLFLGMSWQQAIPCGLTLGGYAIATWSGGKNLVELLKDSPKPPQITD